jgi:drug/metabolite transporter (DMT)-like permease
MSNYAYLIAILVLGISLLAGLYFIESRRAVRTGEKRAVISYLLLWPLIFDADTSKRNGQVLTNREWLGLIVVGLIIVCAIAFS